MANKRKSQQREKSQQIGIRMPMSMIKRIDTFVADLERKTPGMRITRADAIRIMVEHWLSKSEVGTKKRAVEGEKR